MVNETLPSSQRSSSDTPASDAPRRLAYRKDRHTQLHDGRFLPVASPYLLQVYREVLLTEVQTDIFVFDVVVLFRFWQLHPGGLFQRWRSRRLMRNEYSAILNISTVLQYIPFPRFYGCIQNIIPFYRFWVNILNRFVFYRQISQYGPFLRNTLHTQYCTQNTRYA